MSKRSKVKVRRLVRATKSVIQELGKGAGHALRN